MSVAISTETYGLRVGRVELQSVGPLTFGPEGILFVADNAAATIFAIDVEDQDTADETRPINVENLDTRLAAYLGCGREDVFIKDMAVHPTSEKVYLSVMRGSGADAVPLLIKIGGDGELSEVELEHVPFSQTAITDAASPEDERSDGRVVRGTREGEDKVMRSGTHLQIASDRLRNMAVTDMAYVDG